MSADPTPHVAPTEVIFGYPKVLWIDKPEIVEATVGRSPRQLFKYSAQGLSTYTRGKGTGKRYFWITDEVIAFLKATSTNSNEDAVDYDDE